MNRCHGWHTPTHIDHPVPLLAPRISKLRARGVPHGEGVALDELQKSTLANLGARVIPLLRESTSLYQAHMGTRIVAVLVFGSALGCGGQAERCNAAKVEAYDAWESVATAWESAATAYDRPEAAAERCFLPVGGETFAEFEHRCMGGAVPHAETDRQPVVPDCEVPLEGEDFDAFELRCPHTETSDRQPAVPNCDVPRADESYDEFESRCDGVVVAQVPLAPEAPGCDVPLDGEDFDAFELRCSGVAVAAEQPSLSTLQLRARLARPTFEQAALDARRTRDLARGASALAFRDAARTVLEHLRQTEEIPDPVRMRVEAATSATSAHWEQCRSVEP